MFDSGASLGDVLKQGIFIDALFPLANLTSLSVVKRVQSHNAASKNVPPWFSPTERKAAQIDLRHAISTNTAFSPSRSSDEPLSPIPVLTRPKSDGQKYHIESVFSTSRTIFFPCLSDQSLLKNLALLSPPPFPWTPSKFSVVHFPSPLSSYTCNLFQGHRIASAIPNAAVTSHKVISLSTLQKKPQPKQKKC